MWYFHNFPNYPLTVPLWLHTEPWQDTHHKLSRSHAKTGIRAAKKAAKKRRRSKRT